MSRAGAAGRRESAPVTVVRAAAVQTPAVAPARPLTAIDDARSPWSASPLRVWLVALALQPRGAGAAPPRPAPPKVLRYAFRVAETGFDPAQITDLYSRTLTAHIFEALLRATNTWPGRSRCRPQHRGRAARGIGDDFTTLHVPPPPGIYFADDPAFKGRRRELDRRRTTSTRSSAIYDPRWKSPALSALENERHPRPERAAAQARSSASKPFDYDTRGRRPARARPLHAPSSSWREPQPALRRSLLADPTLLGAVAREVVESYGDQIMRASGRHRAVPARRSGGAAR